MIFHFILRMSTNRKRGGGLASVRDDMEKTSETVKGDSSFGNSLAVAKRVKHRITV